MMQLQDAMLDQNKYDSISWSMTSTRTYSPVKHLGKVKSLVGRRYGSFTVTSMLGVYNKDLYWLCRCDCGDYVHVRGGGLTHGNNKRCRSCANKKLVIHGHTKGAKSTAEYEAWRKTKDRCNNQNHKFYACYGGRGIKVCLEWENDFGAFLKS